MGKLERLLNLTAVLLETDIALTASNIRRRIEGYPDDEVAFRRAFERDKEDLREMGVPLVVEEATGLERPVDGYRIDRDRYYLADPGFEADELAALHLASLAVRLDGLSDHEALWKLGGVLPEHSAVAERTVLAGGVASIPTSSALVPMFEAVVAQRQVKFAYRSQSRTVDPWRLEFQRGRWYLTGYDHGREAERNFRLDRIENGVEITAEQVDTTPASDRAKPTAPWEMGEDQPVEVRLLVDGDHVVSARRQLGGLEPHVVRSDGSSEFLVPVANFDAFCTLLFGLLDHAELLEPTGWRERVVARLESLTTTEMN